MTRGNCYKYSQENWDPLGEESYDDDEVHSQHCGQLAYSAAVAVATRVQYWKH